MYHTIRENSDDDQNPIEENMVYYQEETQLEEGLPQNTTNYNLFKHTQDAHKLLVKPNKGITYIHGPTPKIADCVDNSQHPLIIDSGAH
ncbi:hypothetical protein O181_001121 [Austropuccinia psidii MF-1]|uniref:Uncharacterized protein n=1 Tax=Austropuccinia psidii MF-1 TaxID=1389203 RepID=A0A9Q3BAD6_9BASI|nr:hypothetical protein [Austropuccinia psidii MF-1]